jgi:hypothetical protein
MHGGDTRRDRGALAAAPRSAVSSTPEAVATPITVGIHDGSINNCDNNEQWINGAAPPVNGPAAQQVMLNESPNPEGGQGWFAGLHSGTVQTMHTQAVSSSCS